MPRRLYGNNRKIRQLAPRPPSKGTDAGEDESGVDQPQAFRERAGQWFARLPVWFMTAFSASLLGLLLLAGPFYLLERGSDAAAGLVGRTLSAVGVNGQTALRTIQVQRSATAPTPTTTRRPTSTATRLIATPTPQETSAPEPTVEAIAEATASEPDVEQPDEGTTNEAVNEATAEPEPTSEPSATPTEEPTVVPSATPLPNPHEARLLQVIDSAIIEVEFGGQTWRVRYHGIIVPSPGSADTRLAEIGRRALELSSQLLQAQPLLLEHDVTDNDDDGNLLRYAWAGGVHVGLQLVRQGLASVRLSSVDAMYQDELYGAQLAAQAECLGLWACG
ncbi:MAG: thermonuclease family protein [Anaerolineae bacterium]